jgi:hypothetical protein
MERGMRFRIEYLTETTEQGSVCHTRSIATANLTLVQFQAHAWSTKPRVQYGAGGFQIRDLADNGRIVALETFEGPVEWIH